MTSFGGRIEVESKPGRVLIVDDELAVARGLARALRNGPELVIEPDPLEALRRLEHGEAFDLVLCDLMMPTISGEELQRQLSRTRPALADEMVFITGGAFTAAATAFLSTTRNVCLEKPVEPNTRRKVVAERPHSRAA